MDSNIYNPSDPKEPRKAWVRGTVLKGKSNDYIIEKEIDKGGVGTVFKAKRKSDGITVAIKALHGGRFPITEVAHERFAAEIHAQLSLNHPHIICALDAGKRDGFDFLVMEYAEGGTVAQRIHRADYTIEIAFRWCAELLMGIDYLHSKQLVHRDLKPNNLLLMNQKTLKIADMGLLRDLTSEAYLTLSGDQIGSVLYISRRQRNDPATANPEDDAYSVCCCLYEILSKTRLHLYPQDLYELTCGNVPKYVCDLIMGGLPGFGLDRVLQSLRDCFYVDLCGNGHLTNEAVAESLNQIVLLAPIHENPGLFRKQFARNAFLRLKSEMNVSEERSRISFIDFVNEDILVVGSQSMYGSESQPIRFMAFNEPSTLREINQLDIDSPCSSIALLSEIVVWADDNNCLWKSRLYFSSGNIRANNIEFVLQLESRELGKYSIAGHKKCSLVLAAAHERVPILIDIASGESGKAVGDPFIISTYDPKICFFGHDLVALYTGTDIVIFRFSFDPLTCNELKRIEFTSEVLVLGGFRESDQLCIGHIGGMDCYDFSDGDFKFRWGLPDFARNVWRICVSPDDTCIAVQFGSGLIEPGRIGFIDRAGQALLYLPDSGVHDTLRQPESMAWSPSSKRFAVTDRSNYLSVFQRDNP